MPVDFSSNSGAWKRTPVMRAVTDADVNRFRGRKFTTGIFWPAMDLIHYHIRHPDRPNPIHTYALEYSRREGMYGYSRQDLNSRLNGAAWRWYERWQEFGDGAIVHIHPLLTRDDWGSADLGGRHLYLNVEKHVEFGRSVFAGLDDDEAMTYLTVFTAATLLHEFCHIDGYDHPDGRNHDDYNESFPVTCEVSMRYVGHYSEQHLREIPDFNPICNCQPSVQDRELAMIDTIDKSNESEFAETEGYDGEQAIADLLLQISKFNKSEHHENEMDF